MKYRHLLAFAPLALAACSGKAPEAPDPSSTAVEAPPAMASASATPIPLPPAPPSAASLDLPASFRATGTEPFWGAKVEGDTLTYSTPEYPDGMKIAAARKQSGATVTYTGEIDGKPIELAVSAGPCSDGMSDTVYPYTATRTIGPDIARGCAK